MEAPICGAMYAAVHSSQRRRRVHRSTPLGPRFAPLAHLKHAPNKELDRPSRRILDSDSSLCSRVRGVIL